MKNRLLLLQVAIVAIVASLAVWFLIPKTPSSGGAGMLEPAYQRVTKSGVLRSAYVSYPPGTIIQRKGGNVELSGICVDVLNEIGKQLNLKVEYTEEVGWGTAIQGMNGGRYETVCAPVWANPKRSKEALFSKPLMYSVVGVWVREDDTRFTPDNYKETINSPDVRIASLDGSTMIGIAQSDFPKAQLKTYADLTGEPQLFLELTGKKVDVFMAEPVVGYYQLRSHPGTVKNLAAAKPIRAFPVIFLLGKDEAQLKNMFDTAIEELHNSGFIDRVIRKYEPMPNTFFRIHPGFVVPSEK